MKIRKATGTAAVSVAALLMFGACGTGGDDGATPPGGNDADGSETSADGGGDSGAAAIDTEISSWDPCEVLGDSYNELVESLNSVSAGDLLSKPTGGGILPDHAMCSNTVVWAEDPEYASSNADGLVTLSLVPKPSEEEAATRYAELVTSSQELYGDTVAEIPIDGWDEGTLFLGDYGVGDAFTAIVRDGSYLIVVLLETGSQLVAGGDGTQADFTVDEARDHLLDVTLPGVQSAVAERLEEAGVSSGE
ncbi:hypothetical protein [Glycomyces rhizosphaerae]|uniref:DUF3558 domain-containing protein n=1 Tax=Glycomyces rhizosphaerae TaxID=2054422 RepID=A0ABV7Q0E1_9ACTN